MIQHPSLLVNILIVVGESFWVFSASAQLRKLVKTHNTRGLAPVSQTLNTAGMVAWATYFALNHLWFPFSTNVVMFFISAAILGYTLADRKKFAKGLFAIAIVAPITSYALLTYPDLGGWIGMSYNWIAGTPWLYRVVKRRKVSGISEHGMYFAFGAMICVLAYGLIINSLPLIAGCFQGLIYGFIIMRYYYRYRKHG